MQFPETPTIRLATASVFVYRAPVEDLVQTSFGIMHNRPSVVVRLEDQMGAVGWGEIWCNFPGVGAEHRARMFQSCVAPLLLQQAWESPVDAFRAISERLEVLAIQAGEPGTVAQIIAGTDMALWDLAARRLGQPLWQLFGGQPRVQVYASGLNPTDPCRLAAVKHREGYRAFKLKVGFEPERDVQNLSSLRQQFGDQVPLMIDANQAWDLATATRMCQRLSEFNPVWAEEPMRADMPLQAWQNLAKESHIPLAAGENMRGRQQFSEAIASGAFSVMQPDPGKWGGLSGCIPVGRQVVQQKRLFCPHWLGGGIGLAAAMQLKAIVGHDGYVEVDSNPNPLRELFAAPLLRPEEGWVSFPQVPGLGIEPDLSLARDFLVPHDY